MESIFRAAIFLRKVISYSKGCSKIHDLMNCKKKLPLHTKGIAFKGDI